MLYYSKNTSKSGPKAPCNFQAAIVELGDVFLRRAEYYLQKGEIANAMMMQYAKGTYAQLDTSRHAASTRNWPDFAVIALRKKRLEQVLKQQLPVGSFMKADQFQQPYECASCHGRN